MSNRLLADTAVHPAQIQSITHQPYYAWQANGSQQQDQNMYHQPSTGHHHMQSYTSQTPVYHPHSIIPSFEQQFNSNSQTALNSCLGNNPASSAEEQLKTGNYTISSQL